jgi:hypothetical protein
MGNMKLLFMLITLISSCVELVAELEAFPSENGEKFEAACQGIADIIDENLDFIPIWEQLGETSRDRILAGVVEISLAIYRSTTGISGPTIKIGKLETKPFARISKIRGIRNSINNILDKIRD